MISGMKGFKHPSLEGVDPLSLELFREFKKAVALNRRLMTHMLAEGQTHPAQASCLWVLASNDGVSQTDLADLLRVSRPTITVMLQKMEASGLVERRPDEVDQRKIRIYLTDEGRKRARESHDALVNHLSATLGKLSEDDRRELKRLLALINQNTVELLGDDCGSNCHETHKEL